MKLIRLDGSDAPERESAAMTGVYEADGSSYRIVVARVGRQIYAFAPDFGAWPGSWERKWPATVEWLQSHLGGMVREIDRRNCATACEDLMRRFVSGPDPQEIQPGRSDPQGIHDTADPDGEP